MEHGIVQQRFDTALKRKTWEFNNRYESISVLILYWEESDDQGFEKEARDVGNLFHRRCCYKVEYYAIPSKKSQMQLDERLNRFNKDYEGPDRLIIIHYGGHGDQDVNGGKLAVWAAVAEGGPTIKWSELQLKFGHLDSHVLLLLDCCFAGQAARSRNRVIPENMELLAACSMGVKSPLPGPYSFTSNLIRHIEMSLDSKGFANISDIYNDLTQSNSGYERSPEHHLGLRESIYLQPFDKNPAKPLVTKQGAAYVDIRVSLRDKLTESSLAGFIGWLRQFPLWRESLMATEYADDPADISGYYQIDERRLRQDEANQEPIAGGDHVVSAAQIQFSTKLANLAIQIASLSPSGKRHFQNDEKHQKYAEAEIVELLTTLSNVEHALSSLRKALMRRSMTSSPKLAEVIEDSHMKDLGIPSLIEELVSTLTLSRSEVSQRINYPSRVKQSTSLLAEDSKSKGKSVASGPDDTQSPSAFSNSLATGTSLPMLKNRVSPSSKTRHEKDHSLKAESLNEVISPERRLSQSSLKTSQPTGSQDSSYIPDTTLSQKAVATEHLLLDQVKNGNVEMTTYFIEMGADVNHVADISGSTPLLIAAKLRHTQLCLQLLKSGANISAKDNHGRNVLHLALSDNGKEDVISCLLDYDPDLNGQDEDSKTPLHYCVEFDKRDAAQYLLRKGAVTEITSRTGETPLSFAIRMGRTKQVKILLSHGATVSDTNEKNASQGIKYILKQHLDSRREESRSTEQRTGTAALPGRSSPVRFLRLPKRVSRKA